MRNVYFHKTYQHHEKCIYFINELTTQEMYIFQKFVNTISKDINSISFLHPGEKL